MRWALLETVFFHELQSVESVCQCLDRNMSRTRLALGPRPYSTFWSTSIDSICPSCAHVASAFDPSWLYRCISWPESCPPCLPTSADVPYAWQHSEAEALFPCGTVDRQSQIPLAVILPALVELARLQRCRYLRCLSA